MRTTIEIDDEQRAKLLEAAARRGVKGFSSIVQEALTQYFEGEEERKEAVRNACWPSDLCHPQRRIASKGRCESSGGRGDDRR